jgi:hypothetical protein
MPTITQWGVEVDVDLDVDVNDFLDDCSSEEIEQALTWLKDNDYLDGSFLLTGRESINEQEYLKTLTKLKDNWLSLSKEEEDAILNIAKRF